MALAHIPAMTRWRDLSIMGRFPKPDTRETIAADALP
jgi:hypothetical protein